MFRNMLASLVLYEKVETTHAKAMELKKIAERVISKAAKTGDSVGKPLDSLNAKDRAKQIHVRRMVGRSMPRYYKESEGEFVDIMHKLFFILGPRYKDRPGGYVRVTKVGPRRGDNASMSRIELLKDN